ncbi:TOPRIM nucleotidyl transferase/hydrolase domain-containing protein [Streptomyces sp. NPDC048277]|uniref:ATP-dependent nuclease n=1 Tax=Streptomyces sp. NPDC048277 TaxID=3155027 RepID=UPI0033E8BDC6
MGASSAGGRRPADGMRTLCLAIEEPELFQHPPQARTFAKVLRELVAASPQGRTQVMYATHNPVFIDPKGYHQIRRLCRAGGVEHPATEVWQATEEDLCRALDGLVDKKSIRSRTEGVINGCAERSGINLGAEGISVIEVNGKDNIMISDALFSALGVPCYVVFDGDSGMEERKRESVSHLVPHQRQEKEAKFEQQARANRAKNANLLQYLGATPASQPTDDSTGRYTVFEDTLETYLDQHWPTWEERRQELIRVGEGIDGKNAATYLETTRTAGAEPPFLLHALLENVRVLAGRR